MSVTAFAISVRTDLDAIGLTRLLSSELPKRRWRQYFVEVDADVEGEYTQCIQAQAKKDSVTEEDARDLFDSIKQILREHGHGVDNCPFK